MADTYTFLPPISTTTVFIKISEEIGLSTPAASSKTVILKKIACYITIAITIPIFSQLTIFYNTANMTFKGCLAITSHIFNCKILNHDFHDYINDFNMHLAYGLKELIYNRYSEVIAIIFALDKQITEAVDNFVNRLIVKLSINELTEQEEID